MRLRKYLSWKNGFIVTGVVVGLGFVINQSVNHFSTTKFNSKNEVAIPIAGLSSQQLQKFRDTEVVFQHEFTPEEGLGPLFNDRSCFACHGQPGVVGGEGRDLTSTGVVRIGSVRKSSPFYGKPVQEFISETTDADVYNYIFEGGPALERKSITSEFRKKYPAEAACEIPLIPQGCQFRSLRHAMPVLGLGLLDAIDDKDITANIFKEVGINPRMAGRATAHDDPLAQNFRIGRFGWKAQQPNLLMFTAEAMDVEMGITTPLMHHPKSAAGISDFPPALVQFLPPEPNDYGKIMAQLTYFQSLLAPPERGAISEQVKRGEKVFAKAQCAVCHMPTMYTSPEVYVVDPDSPAPQYRYIEVSALENKPVHAYTDLLVHNMGWQLADGLPQAGAKGGEWRTTPLWGLRLKRFYLHDGRTTDLEEVIALHGGQGQEARDKVKQLSKSDRQDLLAFLRSL